jgi:hypothetical protein
MKLWAIGYWIWAIGDWLFNMGGIVAIRAFTLYTLHSMLYALRFTLKSDSDHASNLLPYNLIAFNL